MRAMTCRTEDRGEDNRQTFTGPGLLVWFKHAVIQQPFGSIHVLALVIARAERNSGADELITALMKVVYETDQGIGLGTFRITDWSAVTQDYRCPLPGAPRGPGFAVTLESGAVASILATGLREQIEAHVARLNRRRSGRSGRS